MAKDKPVKVKKEKEPKPDKGGKSGKPQQKYFWTPFLEKRAKKKNPGFVREPAIPKQPTSKEDKMKLMAALAMVVLVPIVFLLMTRHNAAAAAKAAADKSPNRSGAAEGAAMKAADSE